MIREENLKQKYEQELTRLIKFELLMYIYILHRNEIIEQQLQKLIFYFILLYYWIIKERCRNRETEFGDEKVK